MAQLTINDLRQLCQEECIKGNGNRKIVVPENALGENFHGLHHGFYIPHGDEMDIEMGLRDSTTDLDKIAVLE